MRAVSHRRQGARRLGGGRGRPAYRATPGAAAVVVVVAAAPCRSLSPTANPQSPISHRPGCAPTLTLLTPLQREALETLFRLVAFDSSRGLRPPCEIFGWSACLFDSRISFFFCLVNCVKKGKVGGGRDRGFGRGGGKERKEQ